MSLLWRMQRDGRLRPDWYAEFESNGKRRVVNLGVRIRGKPPAHLSEAGDPAFERSRERAKVELKRFTEQAWQKGHASHLIERLIVEKTGHAVEHVRIDGIGNRWLALARARPLAERHAAVMRKACQDFADFMAKRNPDAKWLYEVTVEDAGAFADAQRARLAPGTVRVRLSLLRSCCNRFLPPGTYNPFSAIVTNRTAGDAETDGVVSRVPFTPAQLKRLFDVSREAYEGMLHGPVVTAACTALRRADACGLRWESVDLAAGFVTVHTSKTGATVDLPLFSPMRAVLEAAKGPRKGFCFPAAAKMLKENPHGLSWRFKSIAAQALADGPKDAPSLEIADSETIRAAGMTAIRGLPDGERRVHITDAFTRYMDGASLGTIATAMNTSKGAVSGWLSNVSAMIGRPVIRQAARQDLKASIEASTRRPRSNGCRSASLYDWHALRTSFCTLALSAGVPIELVRAVTGHRTLEMVLRHYFKPGREALRTALAGVMPPVLTGGPADSTAMTPGAELQALSAKLAAGMATDKDKARLRKLAAAL